jgi:hypothetical protein
MRNRASRTTRWVLKDTNFHVRLDALEYEALGKIGSELWRRGAIDRQWGTKLILRRVLKAALSLQPEILQQIIKANRFEASTRVPAATYMEAEINECLDAYHRKEAA